MPRRDASPAPAARLHHPASTLPQRKHPKAPKRVNTGLTGQRPREPLVAGATRARASRVMPRRRRRARAVPDAVSRSAIRATPASIFPPFSEEATRPYAPARGGARNYDIYTLWATRKARMSLCSAVTLSVVWVIRVEVLL